MARVVIWTAPKEMSGDPALDNARYDAGYVVDVLEDDEPISDTVAKETRWRIVNLPGVAAGKLRALAAEEAGFSAAGGTKDPAAMRRAHKIDLKALAAVEADPVKGQELMSDPVKAEAYVKALAVTARAIADAKGKIV
jgi:hypothetical protein